MSYVRFIPGLKLDWAVIVKLVRPRLTTKRHRAVVEGGLRSSYRARTHDRPHRVSSDRLRDVVKLSGQLDLHRYHGLARNCLLTVRFVGGLAVNRGGVESLLWQSPLNMQRLCKQSIRLRRTSFLSSLRPLSILASSKESFQRNANHLCLLQ